MKHDFYVSPVLEILDVEVEKGFAASAGVPDWSDGGQIGIQNLDAAEELNDVLLNDF